MASLMLMEPSAELEEAVETTLLGPASWFDHQPWQSPQASAELPLPPQLPNKNRALRARIIRQEEGLTTIRFFGPQGSWEDHSFTQDQIEIASGGIQFTKGEWLSIWANPPLILPEGQRPREKAIRVCLPAETVASAFTEPAELSQEQQLAELLVSAGMELGRAAAAASDILVPATNPCK